MTVKELKMMLNDMPDDAILLTPPMVPTNARPSSISAMQRKPARIIREIIRG